MSTDVAKVFDKHHKSFDIVTRSQLECTRSSLENAPFNVGLHHVGGSIEHVVPSHYPLP